MMAPPEIRNGEDESDTDNRSESDERSSLIARPPENRYPKRVFFILGNEFCERYSYYGMRTILVLYLKFYMSMTDDTSTAIYHAFTVVAYLFPVFGALVADSWLGKYRTILYLSIVYAVGMILNTLGAVPTLGNLTTHMALSFTGLIVIGIGTGGIKPCVSTFGGDQFHENQEDYRRSFFSIFYFSINAGSLLSTILSPILREDVQCLGRNDCYALAFGLPAVLMFVALVTFAIGTPYYIRNPPEGNVLVEVFVGIKSAIVHRWNTPKKERTKDHWMDYALVDTSTKFVRDTKYVLRVLVLFIPLPLFWALFDQQGSRWTLQATRMNGYIGNLRIKPDQMQVMNPLFILILIPLFEVTVYKWTRNCNFTPLRRMGLGMVFAAAAFVIAAFVQLKMEKTMTPVPEISSQASLRIVNAADCPIHITSDMYDQWAKNEGGIILRPAQVKGIYKKSEKGGAIVRVFNARKRPITVEGLSGDFNVSANNISEATDVDRNRYHIVIYDAVNNVPISQHTAELDTGGVYTLLVMDSVPFPNVLRQENATTKLLVDVKPNDVSLFWMIPQYFVITVGEILLSAPTSMKSVLTSFWLLTVSIGDLITIIVAESKFVPSQAAEYFLFAGLMAVATVVFVILATRYNYVDESEFYRTEGQPLRGAPDRNEKDQ